MITYNWDLGLKILIGWIIYAGLSEILLGAMKVKKKPEHNWADVATGIIILCVFAIPIFF